MRTREGNKEEDILQAAVEVFAAEGYHRAKIARVAERAGVATGSVYLYFDNKEQILLTIFDRLWTTLLREVRATIDDPARSPEEKLDATVDHLFGLFLKNPALATVFANEQHHLIQKRSGRIGEQYDAFLDLAEAIVREGIRRRVFSAAIDLKLFRLFITGGLRNLLRHWARDPKRARLDAMRTNVKQIIRNSLLVRT